jgi:hypothetical protein
MRDGKLVETNVRHIAQSDMLKCPHFIMVAEHYRNDGSCHCNDPDASDMNDWGYFWNASTARWEAQSDE